jgi:hypothetical protein
MNYYKRCWNETTGEELTDSWGTSTFYFEIDQGHHMVRQIQIFENGNALKYSTEFTEDKYGKLSDQPLDIEDSELITIHKSEFEKVWTIDQEKLQDGN